MGIIWTLLSRLLSGSEEHDTVTTRSIFHSAITIISALVRLRRDLVTLTLPHLATALRQLMFCVRRLRPHLGVKQSTMITNTQPRWLNAAYPLQVGEAKALSRLLETLATKTLIRNNLSHVETQRAESLAKPFSKHAYSVITAYIEAMNDPLCVIPQELRKELQSGLYALC